MSSKTDAFVKLGIVLSISLLSFSIGIFAGKKFSDNQHELAILEPQKNTHGADEPGNREVASDSHAAPAPGRTGAMTDDEIAKLAEEFVSDDTVPAHGAEPSHGEHAPASESTAAIKHAPPSPHAAEEHAPETHKPAGESHQPAAGPKPKAAPVTKHEEPSTAAKNIAAGKNPTDAHAAPAAAKQVKEDRLPSSLPKNVAQFNVGKFTVQVASYPQESEAAKMASDLKTKGYSAFYIPANVKGQTYFRVSVGQFATQKEAQSYRTEFLAKSKISSAIVQKISE